MNIKNTKKEKNEVIYYLKYLKYKNKYLQLKNIQIGGDKPFISNINAINLFTDPDMEKYLNPIYGLIMCESGYIINNYYLRKSELINTPESILIKKISNSIPGSIQPTNDIINIIKPIDIGRYIAIKYINKKTGFISISKTGRYTFGPFTPDTPNGKILGDYILKINNVKNLKINTLGKNYFHILLYCLWWIANNDEGIEEYYKGINDVFQIFNEQLEEKYYINDTFRPTSNESTLENKNEKMIPSSVARNESVSGEPTSNESTLENKNGKMIPSSVARNEPVSGEPTTKEPSPKQLNFEKIIFKITNKPFKIFNQEHAEDFCDNSEETYPDCGEVTARNLINLICFNENKFDIGILEGFGAIEELKEYYSVFSNFDLQSSTYRMTIYGYQLNARDAWSKLIISYANTNLALKKSCKDKNQKFELTSGLALDGQRSNFLQLIKNLLLEIEDFSSIKTSSIESINDNTTDGFGIIEIEHKIYDEIVIHCLDGHYYMHFKHNIEDIEYNHLEPEKQNILNTLLNKSLDSNNYIDNKFNSELLVEKLNESGELNKECELNNLKEKLFELSITDQYDIYVRRRIYIDVDKGYFNNIVERLNNIEKYIEQLEQYTYYCNDFIFLEKIPLLKHLNVKLQNIDITNIDLKPLSNIVSIGDYFLIECSSLKNIDLTPLSKLESIGDYFLNECSSLIEIKLPKSSKITSIGYNFLSECIMLKNIDLTPLSKLESFEYKFLSKCIMLKNIDLTPLSKLESIGDYFLNECSSLIEINLSQNIKSIGNNFLDKCIMLENIDLTPLLNLESIGNRFLYKCNSLKKIDLPPLSNLKSIGDDFLAECIMLENIDLTPLSKLESIGEYFLDGCSHLIEIKCTKKQSEILETNNIMNNYKKITITD